MRVIAGSARGVPLEAPRGAGTRPTSDLLKGAIFSALGERGCTGRVLDLYAGSGALGIETLSRGADYAILVESNRAACRVIEANLRKCRLDDRAKVYCLPVERALDFLEAAVAAAATSESGEGRAGAGAQGRARVSGRRLARTFGIDAESDAERARFDLVLLDPPYSDQRLDAVLERLGRSPLLAPGATILVEHAASRPLASPYGEAHWEKTRRHGDSAFSVYVRRDEGRRTNDDGRRRGTHDLR